MGFSFPQGSPVMPRTGGRAQLLLLEVLSFDGSSSFGRNGNIFWVSNTKVFLGFKTNIDIDGENPWLPRENSWFPKENDLLMATVSRFGIEL